MAKKKKECWKNSKAKAVLYTDIVEGRVPVEPDDSALKPKELWDQYKNLPEFQINDYNDHTKFSNRLRSLRTQIKEQYERADADFRAFVHDRQIFPEPEFDYIRGYPHWNKSRAKKLLIRDIDIGKHKRVRPIKLYYTRPEYQEFPLKVFRDHIYQEVRKKKKRSKKKTKVKNRKFGSSS
jgi:hypothetical protein